MTKENQGATPVGGIDQIHSEGLYRIASGFYCQCYRNNSLTRVLVYTDVECRYWVGMALKDSSGDWRWFNVQISETGVGSVSGPEFDLVSDVYGRLQPPVPAIEQVRTSQHVQGLEQLEASGVYRLAGRFTVICTVMQAGFITAIVQSNDYRLIGVAHRRGVLWSWHSAKGNGSSSAHISWEIEALIKVDGHLLPPIDMPRWSPGTTPDGMTSMLVTERERAAVLAFRGEHAQPLFQPEI